MRIALATICALFALALVVPQPAVADARLGLQIGGTATFLYDDAVRAMDEDTDFAVGVFGDIDLVGVLGLHVGALIGFDPMTMHTDGLVGLRIRATAEEDRIWFLFRTSALVKYFFAYDAAADGGVGVGVAAGPGLEFSATAGSVFTFDIDVQVWKFVAPESFKDADLQVGMAYMIGWRF